MAALNTYSEGGRSQSGFMTDRLGELRQAWARYKVYRETRAELRALSLRDLEDIGIQSTEIDAIARKAAHLA